MTRLPTLYDRRIEAAWPQQHGFSLTGRRLLGWQYNGSLAHGTAGAVIDDVDMFAVVNPPQSLWPFEHWVLQQDELDVLVYSVTKWLKLLYGSNPNMLASLGTVWHANALPEGVLNELTQACRTKQALIKSLGYARSHLLKLERGKYEGYQGAARKRLFDQFGYDVKGASHAIRILRFGLEYAATGVLHVQRTDAAELRAIKGGAWTLEQVRSTYERLEGQLDAALACSTLPEHPNPDHFNRVLRELQQ